MDKDALGPLASLVLLVVTIVDTVGGCAIRLGLVISLAADDRELATSAGADDLLLANSGVVNDGGSADLVDVALACLVVA